MMRLRILCFAALMAVANIGSSQEHPFMALEGREFPAGVSRLALVVWAESYRNHSRVHNAESDGSRIAQELSKLPFDFLRVIPDAKTADEIYDGVSELRAQIAASSRPVVVLFYFAGHGFQVDGENFLVPTTASSDSTSALVADSAKLTDISRQLNPSRQSGILLMLLDSCRTVRFLEDGTVKDFPLKDGLEPGFREGNLLAPALVSMAAAPRYPARSVSRFENGKNSPYTTALASRINTVGQSLMSLLEGTQKQVIQDTDQTQRPTWFNGAIGSKVFFKPRDVELLDDERAWRVVVGRPENVRGCVLDYLLTYPIGRYALQAEYMLRIAGVGDEYCSVN